MKDIDDEIREAEDRVESLKLRKARLAMQTPEQRVASMLHSLFCHSNHDDACSWLYEQKNKTDDWNGDTHLRWLEKAEKFVDVLGANKAIEAIDALGEAMN